MRKWILPLVLLLATSAAPAQQAEDERSALYAMSAEEFFELPQTQAPLERGRIDDAMLDAAVFHATNQARRRHDLQPLRYDARLAEAAQVHMDSMLEHGYLAHENPHDESLRWPLDRVLRTGYPARAVSENLAQVFRLRYDGSQPYYRFERDGRPVFSYEPDGQPIPPHSYESLARQLMDEWLNSPSHRENLLRESSEELGVAVDFRWKEQDLDEALAVQVFAQPRR